MSNLNMPLAVLNPVLTATHKAKLAVLGFKEINTGLDGEVSFILTDDGAGKGRRSWTLGASAFLIKTQHLMGNGTIYDTVDDLITALESDTPKA